VAIRSNNNCFRPSRIRPSRHLIDLPRRRQTTLWLKPMNQLLTDLAEVALPSSRSMPMPPMVY